ncbi:MAG: hypothetical protein KF850_15140 [Labilithrix sp.]|nr:hypothetical protein [Labilithrix sp.]
MPPVKNNEHTESPAAFHSAEERWFGDYSRERARPVRQSPTTPPPPIGDALADRWFR